MGRNQKIISLSLMLALAAGDGWGMGKPPDKKPAAPKKPVPAHLESLDAESATKTLTLNECYLLALKRSETVAITKEDIERAKTAFFTATSTVLGTADFLYDDFIQQKESANSSVSASGVQQTLTDPERITSNFNFQQPLFQGFKSLALFKGAGALTAERKDQYIRAKQLLFEDVMDSYLLLLYRRREIAIIEGIHKLYQNRIGDLDERVKVGRSRESEVVNARSKMKILEADYAQAKGALYLSKYMLEFLTGIPIDPALIQEDETDINESKPLPAYLEESQDRPDVKAAKHAVAVNWSNIVVAQSNFWPTVTMENNQYTHREGFQSGIDWDLLFAVDVPLFRGGGTFGKTKDAISQWKQAKLRYSEASRRAVLEINQAYNNWETSLKQGRALDEALMLADENFRLQTQDYTRSLVSNLDVLDALEQLNNAQRESNQVRYQTKQYFWRLRVASGEIK